ncbi:proton-conducting transporter membrane subunit [uncultured Rikenella sp.]|uniref:proton-conducting transporter transmembrane domain-containing protein n=1 Tax=uncultured Rikenella sp. TaxID=368003 RepID=UPI00260BB8F3|nr:proton-conducting transporter membrane subunit [uncultured Rikenella sp.]
MLIHLFILSSVLALLVGVARQRAYVQFFAGLFFAVQAAFAVWAVLNRGTTTALYFTFDTLGVTYYALMALVGWLCCWQSSRYLDQENLREYKIYLISLIALNVALTGVYFANNITVTWIFLEATTLAAAGLTYHRRTLRSLEATWKYIFISSVGIAIAYLGVLLLSTVAAAAEGEADLSYAGLTQAIASGAGNALYIRLAFLFIVVGYSSKLEIFPFCTVGVDANHSAPTPTSAFLSSALVGGGFVAVFRVWKAMQGAPEVAAWCGHVLLLLGGLSLLMAAVYLGRTRNLKRLAAYSTVENSGLMMLGLGIGGIGVWAAVLHSLAHTLIKGSFLMQLSVVGKMFGNYRVARNGGYFRVDPLGGLVLVCCLIALIAVPPSVLFRTEYLILTGLLGEGWWWIFIPVALLLVTVIYWLCSKLLPLLFRPVDLSRVRIEGRNPWLSAVLLLMVLATFVAGVWQAPELVGLIDSIAY